MSLGFCKIKTNNNKKRRMLDIQSNPKPQDYHAKPSMGDGSVGFIGLYIYMYVYRAYGF